jgi:hypothetical protein
MSYSCLVFTDLRELGLPASAGQEYIANLILSDSISAIFMEAFINRLEETEVLTDVFIPVFQALHIEMSSIVPSATSYTRVYDVRRYDF